MQIRIKHYWGGGGVQDRGTYRSLQHVAHVCEKRVVGRRSRTQRKAAKRGKKEKGVM